MIPRSGCSLLRGALRVWYLMALSWGNARRRTIHLVDIRHCSHNQPADECLQSNRLASSSARCQAHQAA
jgi:hypothetical protein